MKRISIKLLQREQAAWAERNFGKTPSWQPLLGAVEELGELAHAHLKTAQKIRTEENHGAKKIDAIGDIVIYLVDYCTREGIDMEAAIAATWAQVRKRDWKKNPKNGKKAQS